MRTAPVGANASLARECEGGSTRRGLDTMSFITYEILCKHIGHVGVYIRLVGELVEIRCCDRTHGGNDILLIEVRRPLIILDTTPDIEGSFEIAAKRGGWD